VIVGYINKAGNITHIYFKIFEKLKCSLLLILTMKLIFLKKKNFKSITNNPDYFRIDQVEWIMSKQLSYDLILNLG
jgi:hypothetical protein